MQDQFHNQLNKINKNPKMKKLISPNSYKIKKSKCNALKIFALLADLDFLFTLIL